MSKLKLDLHDIYNKGQQIDNALEEIIKEAVDKKIKLVEIIPGKGSGQLKKKVIRFLQLPSIKNQYLRPVLVLLNLLFSMIIGLLIAYDCDWTKRT